MVMFVLADPVNVKKLLIGFTDAIRKVRVPVKLFVRKK